MNYETKTSLFIKMSEINLSLIGARLKEERKKLGLSQSEAADLVGLTREHWGRCERGTGIPGGEVFAELANSGANVLYILTGEREGPEPEALTSEERVMLEYFRQASPPIRKAALGALLSAAPGAANSSPKHAIHIGNLHGQNIEGSQTNHGPMTFGVSPSTKSKKPK